MSNVDQQKSKLIWPDEIRKKMIEKSEFYYGSEKIYKFGYYDGFQKAIENCDVLPSQLLKQRDEALELLKKTTDKIGFFSEFPEMYREIHQYIKSNNL